MNHIIKKKQLKSHGTSPKHEGKAHIELLRDGDVVRAIEVRCACGSATVVELDYADPQSPAPNSR
ncbi:MAG: hypothetical protein ACI8QZ_000009 [Chlamydiales bacterium]|jgi:hypothetical protein